MPSLGLRVLVLCFHNYFALFLLHQKSKVRLKTYNNQTPAPDLWKYSALFRSPSEVQALNRYLVEDAMKTHVLECFKTGFVSHFEYPLPKA